MSAELYFLDTLHSSYKANDYKWVFFGLARTHKPKVCVELGVLEGYSLCATALGLKYNGRGIIHGYDLWEDYPYRHTSMGNVQKTVCELKLVDYVRLYKADASNVLETWDDGSLDWIHVDLSNDGDVFEWTLDVGHFVLREEGLLLLEGGSQERDEVDWMLKYDKPPIVPILDSWRERYEIVTFLPFPSLTVCRKR